MGKVQAASPNKKSSTAKSVQGTPQAAGSISAGTKRVPPKLSAVVAKSPNKKTRTQSVPSEAPIQWCWYKYGEDASVYFDRMPRVTLYMGILQHMARPGILWKLHVNLDSCLATLHQDDEMIPGSVADLRDNWNVRIAYKPKEDPDQLGFSTDTVAFYVAGDQAHLENFLNLMDCFFEYRKANPELNEEFPSTLKVTVEHNANVMLNNPIEGLAIPTEIQDPSKNMTIQFWTASPPGSTRHLTADIQENESSDTI